eukprot:938403-Amphidinium_carterae.1
MDSLHTPAVWSVGTSERKEFKGDVVPGPGAHESNTTVGEGPRYTHGLPHKAYKPPAVPGPGVQCHPLIMSVACQSVDRSVRLPPNGESVASPSGVAGDQILRALRGSGCGGFGT